MERSNYEGPLTLALATSSSYVYSQRSWNREMTLKEETTYQGSVTFVLRSGIRRTSPTEDSPELAAGKSEWEVCPIIPCRILTPCSTTTSSNLWIGTTCMKIQHFDKVEAFSCYQTSLLHHKANKGFYLSTFCFLRQMANM